jgi:dihydrofolate reductase
MIPKASVFMAMTVDGFIARLDHSLDFLPETPEDHGYQQFFDSVDAVVIGRNTYDKVLSFGSWGFGRKPVVVLSSRPFAPPDASEAVVERLSGSPHAIMEQLGSRGWKHVYVDGGITVTRFLEVGLVQKLILTRVPVLIGNGIPLFGALPRDIKLQHVATRSYPSGLVQSEYAVSQTS